MYALFKLPGLTEPKIMFFVTSLWEGLCQCHSVEVHTSSADVRIGGVASTETVPCSACISSLFGLACTRLHIRKFVGTMDDTALPVDSMAAAWRMCIVYFLMSDQQDIERWWRHRRAVWELMLQATDGAARQHPDSSTSSRYLNPVW